MELPKNPLIKKIINDHFYLENIDMDSDVVFDHKQFYIGKIRDALVAAYKVGSQDEFYKYHEQHEERISFVKKQCELNKEIESRLKVIAKNYFDLNDFHIDSESEAFKTVRINRACSAICQAYYLGVSDESDKIEPSDLFLIKRIAREYFDLDDDHFTLDAEQEGRFLPIKRVDLAQIKEGLTAAYQSGESEAFSKHQKSLLAEKEPVSTTDVESRIKNLAKNYLEIDDFDVDPESEDFNRVFSLYDLSSALVEAYKLGVFEEINKHEMILSEKIEDDQSVVFLENIENGDQQNSSKNIADTQGMD